jgi:hypothetical protein
MPCTSHTLLLVGDQIISGVRLNQQFVELEIIIHLWDFMLSLRRVEDDSFLDPETTRCHIPESSHVQYFIFSIYTGREHLIPLTLFMRGVWKWFITNVMGMIESAVAYFNELLSSLGIRGFGFSLRPQQRWSRLPTWGSQRSPINNSQCCTLHTINLRLHFWPCAGGPWNLTPCDKQRFF